MVMFLSRVFRKLKDFEQTFANDPDQFVILRYLTFLYAMRYDSPSRVWQRTLWYGYCSVMLFLFTTYCYKAYWHITRTAYTFSTFNVLATIWIITGALVRRLLFDRADLVRLVRFLNDRTFRGVERDVWTARRTVQRQNNRYLVAIVLTLLLETFLFLGKNLKLQPEFMLEYNGHVIGGFAFQVLYGFTTCYWGSLYVLIFFFIYAMLNVLRVEMSILAQSFEQTNQILNQHRSSLSASATCIVEERKFWSDLRNLLKKNVQRHVELLE
uniref:Uncharacterized protein n=1 Tax=Anopheles maculatus TaxID=74869 RepID=A0A182SHQ8_9DIPT